MHKPIEQRGGFEADAFARPGDARQRRLTVLAALHVVVQTDDCDIGWHLQADSATGLGNKDSARVVRGHQPDRPFERREPFLQRSTVMTPGLSKGESTFVLIYGATSAVL